MSWKEDKINLFKNELKKYEKRYAVLKDLLYGKHLSKSLEAYKKIGDKWNADPAYKHSKEFDADLKEYKSLDKKAKLSLDPAGKLINEYYELGAKITDINNDLWSLERSRS